MPRIVETLLLVLRVVAWLFTLGVWLRPLVVVVWLIALGVWRLCIFGRTLCTLMAWLLIVDVTLVILGVLCGLEKFT